MRKNAPISSARRAGVGLADAWRMLRKSYAILAVTITASACGGATETPNPPAAQHEQPTKQELAQELSSMSLDEALKRSDYFSPLCDGDGYPLPGNINAKEPGT